jgi:hypothetical protein
LILRERCQANSGSGSAPCGADRPWPEVHPGPVGDEVVRRRADDGDVGVFELRWVCVYGAPPKLSRPA